VKHSLKWDERFLHLAEVVASWSKDPSTQVGAVIVDGDKRIVSVGFNGFARHIDDADGLYLNREVKYSRIIHAEMNAILHARESLTDMTLYTWPVLPCERCAVHVIQTGISRVVAPACPAHMLERWGPSLAKTREFFQEACVSFKEDGAGYDP
jgi:dCMP deaminase